MAAIKLLFRHALIAVLVISTSACGTIMTSKPSNNTSQASGSNLSKETVVTMDIIATSLFVSKYGLYAFAPLTIDYLGGQLDGPFDTNASLYFGGNKPLKTPETEELYFKDSLLWHHQIKFNDSDYRLAITPQIIGLTDSDTSGAISLAVGRNIFEKVDVFGGIELNEAGMGLSIQSILRINSYGLLAKLAGQSDRTNLTLALAF